MKKYFLLINVIVGFGCNQTLKKEVVISPAKMTELLIDIHILEARVDKLRLTNDSAFAIYNTLQMEIFEQNEVTKSDYERSYQYYLSEPKELDQIYAIVVDSLNVIQKRGYKEEDELVKLTDFKPSLDSMAMKNRLMKPSGISTDSLLKK